MPVWLSILSQFSAVAFALLGGVFLAFSDFIMRSFSLANSGAVAMQTINREIFRSIFMVLFIGMVPVSLLLATGAWFASETAWPLLIAAAIYLIGVFGVTAARNVPMNDALEALDPNSADLSAYWAESYLPNWTFWNSVRTGACLIAACLVQMSI